MRKLLFLFVLMLTGCGLMATPTPTRTPRPTATPTEALEYYPTVEPEIQMLLTEYFEEYKKIPAYQEVNGEKSLTVWPLISTGKIETIPIREKNIELDVIWVIHYTDLAPVQFPYVYGIWLKDENTYYLFANSPSSQPAVSDRDVTRKEILTLLPRGIPFLVRVGTFVERAKVDWEKCNYQKSLCEFGSYYSDEIDFGVTPLFINRTEQKVPNWWFLYGWLFDNLGTSVRVNLP